MKENVLSGTLNKVKDVQKPEDKLDLLPSKADTLVWNQLIPNDSKGSKPFELMNSSKSFELIKGNKPLELMKENSSVVGRPSKEFDVDKKIEFEAALVSDSIVDALSADKISGPIKFMVELPGQHKINVTAIENHNYWDISLFTKDKDLKKKLRRSRKDLESSIGEKLEKRAIVSVN